MRLMHRAAALLVLAFIVGLSATPASAQVVAAGNGVIIKGPAGGPYTISRDGGRTWAPYVIRPVPRPVELRPVPKAPGQVCDFYQCGGRIIAVPTTTPGPANGRLVGTGTIHGNKVDPKTNVVR